MTRESIGVRPWVGPPEWVNWVPKVMSRCQAMGLLCRSTEPGRGCGACYNLSWCHEVGHQCLNQLRKVLFFPASLRGCSSRLIEGLSPQLCFATAKWGRMCFWNQRLAALLPEVPCDLVKVTRLQLAASCRFPCPERLQLGPSVVPFCPFLGQGSPIKIYYRKKGTLILTSLLEDLINVELAGVMVYVGVSFLGAPKMLAFLLVSLDSL